MKFLIASMLCILSFTFGVTSILMSNKLREYHAYWGITDTGTLTILVTGVIENVAVDEKKFKIRSAWNQFEGREEEPTLYEVTYSNETRAETLTYAEDTNGTITAIARTPLSLEEISVRGGQTVLAQIQVTPLGLVSTELLFGDFPPKTY